MGNENTNPTLPPSDQPAKPLTGQPPEPLRQPNPNVLPPNPVQVQEGFKPVDSTKKIATK